MNTEMLTADELAVCAAMVERAEQESEAAEASAVMIKRLRQANDGANDLLALIVSLHAHETARCKALGVTECSLTETLDKYDVLPLAALAHGMLVVQEGRH